MSDTRIEEMQLAIEVTLGRATALLRKVQAYAGEHFGETSADLTQAIRLGLAEHQLEAMRVRHSLDARLSDIAWTILLDLYVNDGHRKVSVSGACHGCGAPATTGLRWISVLVETGFVARRDDPADARRVWLNLTDQGRQLVEQWLDALHRLSVKLHMQKAGKPARRLASPDLD